MLHLQQVLQRKFPQRFKPYLLAPAQRSHHIACIGFLFHQEPKLKIALLPKSFGRVSPPSVTLCHSSSVFHTIIPHLVPNLQGKTLIFCCMFFFFLVNLSFQVSVEKFSPLLDLKVLNFLSSDPIIYLDGPIFSRLLIAFVLTSLKLGTDTDVSLECQF